MNSIPNSQRVRTRQTAAFSLMEIMAAIVILGILAAVMVPRLTAHQDTAKKSACYADKRNIEVQAKLWKRNKGTYPLANLSDIGADTSYLPDGLPTCPVDGTSYTINTTTGLVVGH